MNNIEIKKDIFFSKPMVWVAVFAVVSLMVSGALFFFQIVNGANHIAGQVESVSSQSIIITNSRGKITEVIFDENTKLNFDIAQLQKGDFVRMYGHFENKQTLRADGIGLLDDKPKKKI